MTAGRTVTGGSLDWCTPPNYVDAARESLGGTIHLDPCSNQWSLVRALTEWVLPLTDGLVEPWDFQTIYVNPPYGADRERGTRIKDWLRKCSEANGKYGSEVVALVPVATNTSHWKQYVWPTASMVCFLYDTRLRFLMGEAIGKGAPMACATIYWGANNSRFAESFRKYGAVLDLSARLLPKSREAANSYNPRGRC